MSVVFTYRNGRVRSMSLVHARILQRLGHGTFAEAPPAPARIPGIKVVVDRSAETVEEVAASSPETVAPAEDAVDADADDDGLDQLDADALRAIAAERGVKVHHKAGAEKIRAALREASR